MHTAVEADWVHRIDDAALSPLTVWLPVMFFCWLKKNVCALELSLGATLSSGTAHVALTAAVLGHLDFQSSCRFGFEELK